MTLPEWSSELSRELGVELELDIKAILDVARDAAHRIERPAAPVTTFLVGYAAALRGGSAEDIAACVAVASRLAATHSVSAPDGPPPA
jgi:Domain of unknown function (DUF6457)